MKKLVSTADWLPDDYARVSESSYRQYLLYCDPFERFSVVSFVWGPEQKTPIHNHAVWGVIGQLVGEEMAQSFAFDTDGSLAPVGDAHMAHPGDVSSVSPRIGDIHQVWNPSTISPAISIHAYGGNIGRITRKTFTPSIGTAKPFISSYSNDSLPNIWK
ncbi:cysteine dioxygenase family protein [Ferrovibrio xuzhouensis]|uniref:Cysteine dioxygenase n=1 Tax=Ferrovibrio xuzhouensis TaxID=1576914 RepID=A0ABV7VJI7_9PROT